LLNGERPLNESAKVLLEKFLTDAVSDERLSPEEQTKYEAICHRQSA